MEPDRNGKISRQAWMRFMAEEFDGLTSPRPEEGNYVPRDFADWREIPLETLEPKEDHDRIGEDASLEGSSHVA
jgi:hypothetical protein